ncbi:MAG: hypothetical protein LBQ12_14965 [Deltaproteobacteria bacterium]|nr:hypothetical protein [Deltaproteobacteria bacterium]
MTARLARHLATGNLTMAEVFFSFVDQDDILLSKDGARAAALEGFLWLYLTKLKQ